LDQEKSGNPAQGCQMFYFQCLLCELFENIYHKVGRLGRGEDCRKPLKYFK
jgi:hypothetical protein